MKLQNKYTFSINIIYLPIDKIIKRLSGLKFNRFNFLYCYFIHRLILVQSIFHKWNNFSFLFFFFFFVSLSYRYFNRSTTGNNKLIFRINSVAFFVSPLFHSFSLSLCYSKRYIKLIYRLTRSLNRNAGAKNELSKISRPVHLICKCMVQSEQSVSRKEREREGIVMRKLYIANYQRGNKSRSIYPVESLSISPDRDS